MGSAFAPALFAYTPSESTQRVPIKWSATQIPIILQHNPTDITSVQSAAILNEALGEWNSVSPVKVVSTNHGNNTVSYSTDPRYFGPGVVAVTVLNYDAGDGRVSSGKILVNQTTSREFCLTTDKAASNCTTPGALFLPKIYLGDVIAHEIGHFLGLGHSEVRDSSMLYTTFKGQHTPHSDDVAGVRNVYGVAGYGSLSGVVKGGNNVAVFGAHVQAISTKYGTVAASAITQENGKFSIRGLSLNDTYYLYVEPLRNLDALPDAYRSAKKDFCPGSYVGSFFEACGSAGKGHPQPFKLTSSTTSINVGVFTIRCQVRVGENYLREKISSGGGTYSFAATPAKPGESFVGLYTEADVFPSNSYSSTYADTVELDLSHVTMPSGVIKLDLKLLTAALGSALDFSVEIDGPFGVITDPDRPIVSGQPVLAYDATTLRALYDRKISYPLSSNPALNLITIRLSPRTLSLYERTTHLPMNEFFVLDERPWLMLASVTRNGEIYYQNQTNSQSDNASCIDAPYTFAVRANPVSASAMAGESTDTNADATAQTTGCGTWEPPSSGGGQGPWAGTFIIGVAMMIFSRRKRVS